MKLVVAAVAALLVNVACSNSEASDASTCPPGGCHPHECAPKVVKDKEKEFYVAGNDFRCPDLDKDNGKHFHTRGHYVDGAGRLRMSCYTETHTCEHKE